MQRTLGNYDLIGKLGEGGMGVVYLAEHRRLQRRAAVKVLSGAFGVAAPELAARVLERFFAEARATSSIRHPGIVEVLDCGVDSGTAYIVMEYLEGQSLAGVLADARGTTPRFSLPEAAWVVARVAEAMRAAHAKDIVHRDLKPDNVFVLAQPVGAIKVLDFGIAKLLDAQPAPGQGTRTGHLLGTPRYMSPEQCRGAGRVDRRTDIYALGCIFYELVCGRPPFVSEGFGELISAHIGLPPPPPRSFAPELPPAVEALLLALLAKEPDARPTTMDEVLRQLGELGLSVPPPFARLLVDVHAPELFAGAEAGGASAGPDAPTVAAPEALGTVAPIGALAGGTVALAPEPMRGATTPRLVGQVEATAGQTSVTATERAATARRTGRGAGLAVGAAAALAGVVGLVWLKQRTGADSSATAATPSFVAARPATTAGSVASPAASADTPTETSIDVAVAPAGLVVFVDGRSATLPLRLPRTSATHQLRIEAPGYLAQELSLDGLRDRTLVLELTRVPAPAASSRDTPVEVEKKPARRSRSSKAHAFTDL